jgi:hypothetical protein
MTQRRSRRGALRLIAGAGISALFLVLTVSRVDLVEVGAALGRVQFGILVLALPVIGVELVLRSLRWQRLLLPLAPIPLRRSVAYLLIGYFANSLLPARLGDVARAFLAGRAFGVGRLAALGTIVVERLADGVFILAAVVVFGAVVVGGASLATTALAVGGAGVGGLLALAIALRWLRHSSGGRVRSALGAFVERVLAGVAVVRAPGVAVATAMLTVAAFAASVTTFVIVAGAAGGGLTLAQCVLVMGGLALSTSIPAGPGSIGTYEFVGLSIMVALGLTPETALAIAVLVHLVATLPLAIGGLGAIWQLHFRFSEIAEDAEPANFAAESTPGL